MGNEADRRHDPILGAHIRLKVRASRSCLQFRRRSPASPGLPFWEPLPVRGDHRGMFRIARELCPFPRTFLVRPHRGRTVLRRRFARRGYRAGHPSVGAATIGLAVLVARRRGVRRGRAAGRRRSGEGLSFLCGATGAAERRVNRSWTGGVRSWTVDVALRVVYPVVPGGDGAGDELLLLIA